MTRHVGEAVARHAKDDRVHRIAGAGAVIDNASAVLQRQLAVLERHGKAIGGTGWAGAAKDSLTAVTGFFTGLYGTLRGEAASRMLRDDYTGLSFLLVCTQMLHTTALAVGDATTADLCRRHIQEIAPIIIAINGVLPRAVVADVGADRVPIANPHAADEAAREHAEAWRGASASA